MNTQISRYKSSDFYKDPSLEWMGKIPFGWKLKPLKYLFTIQDTRLRQDPSVDTLLSVSGYDGIVPKNLDGYEGQMPSEDVSEYRIVRKNDLVVNTMWLNYTGLGVSNYDGYVSPAYRAYKIGPEIYPRFAHYLLRSPVYVQQYSSLLYGVRPNSLQVKPYDFDRIEVLIPTIDEQITISDFLDTKLSLVDSVIEKKKHHLELLQAKRRVLITQAVTKGLDPNAKMKDSGVDWIREIPENWQIIRGKYIFTKIMRPVKDDDETITCFRDGEVTKRSNRRIDGFTESLKEIGYQGIRRGDLVIHTMDAFAGAVGVSDSDGKGSPILSVCQAQKNDSPIYYAYLIRHMAESKWIEALTKGIRQRSTDFRYETFAQQYLPRPSIQEQKIIASVLEKNNKKIKQLIYKIEAQIDKLYEYKSALVHNTVTGKIKV